MNVIAAVLFFPMAVGRPAAPIDARSSGTPTTQGSGPRVTSTASATSVGRDTLVAPILQFPDPGLDDTAAYRGYQTRFYKDADGNTVQIYVNQRDSRVVNLWADADDESLGFTARDGGGTPATVQWASTDARVSTEGRTRSVQYKLKA